MKAADLRTAAVAVSTAVVVAVAGALAIFLVRDSSSSSGAPAAHADPTSVSTPADPVPILAEMHVPLQPGESAGRVDIYGDRYATGQFADGEQVAVYTYTNQQAESQALARNSAPSDVNKMLVGTTGMFTVTVTGVDAGSGGIVFPDSLSTLARETGAQVK